MKGKKQRKAAQRPESGDDGFSLQAQEGPEDAAAPRKGKGKAKPAGRGKSAGDPQVISYRHQDKRKNNPQVGLVNPESDPEQPKTTWAYDPHLDPALQFDVGRAQVEKLIDGALASGDEKRMRAALQELKRLGEPYLNWTGKAERTSFAVDTVSLYVHERIDPASILAAVRKRMKDAQGKDQEQWKQPDLFAAPFENLPLHDAIDFYKHERGWANRLIAGDSLLVMNSLLQKESMAGQVQMIYIDPPYGIKYGSNFQPFVNKRDVTDRRDQDLTQEPEMIKAFRDTWELGIHSYLTYLRDRLLLAHELLSDTGSLFIQIGDENVHRVNSMVEEIFGAENFIGLIWFRKKTMPLGATYLERMGDYIVWFAKNREKAKFRRLFQKLDVEGDFHWSWRLGNDDQLIKYSKKELENAPAGDPVRLVSMWPPSFSEKDAYDFSFRGKKWPPAPGQCYPSTQEKLNRLVCSNRLEVEGNYPCYIMRLSDDETTKLNLTWHDTVGARNQKYVVETNPEVVQRCVLMTTDPGDLVLDPTCGSGTTAWVAEKLGRRWITTDTSRIAVTLARQRLMTAGYDYYELKYPQEGLKSGFIYETAPKISLSSIINNPEIDEIYGRLHPTIEAALKDLNKTAKQSLKEWEVPFEFPAGWPAAARNAFDAFRAARQAMQKKMDESIASHADQETRYDKSAVSKNKLRITGPFTVEAVPFPSVLSLDEAEQPKDADVAIARSGESSRQHQWRDELLKTGIRGKGGQMLMFAGLDVLPTRHLHLSGVLADSGDRVVVSFGPEHAALEQRQVEMAMREAGELFPRPKMIVFCAFTFDPEAAKDIDQTKGITALKAQMNTDLLTEDLKKARSSNQSFWLMGQPDVDVRKRKDGKYEVEVNGFDYFDTVKGELISGGKGKIAAWMLDIDYDERSLFPRQVFFPMAGKDDGWFKLKKDIKAELNEDLLSKFHGTVSLPFEAGENRRVAVKIVDDRGIESLKVVSLD